MVKDFWRGTSDTYYSTVLETSINQSKAINLFPPHLIARRNFGIQNGDEEGMTDGVVFTHHPPFVLFFMVIQQNWRIEEGNQIGVASLNISFVQNLLWKKQRKDLGLEFPKNSKRALLFLSFSKNNKPKKKTLVF